MSSPNRPWPVITDYLHKKYNIVGEVDLIEIDWSVEVMYNYLKSLRKDRYEPNERILIYHYDTDFYIGNTGAILYNLFLCLSALDIPIEFCIFLTNNYGIKNEINRISLTDSTNLTVFESNYTLLQSSPMPTNTDIDVDLIQYPFICLQGIKRHHRLVFSCGLQDRGILDKGLVSWHFNSMNPTNSTYDFPLDPLPENLRFIVVEPFSRINEKWRINQYTADLYNRYHHLFGVDFKHPEIDRAPNADNFQIDAIKKAFLYVSAETVFNYPYPYLTEKTFKTFLYKRPFVILGAKNSIKQLQMLGFKTFNDVWDESYDQIEDPNLRLAKVLDIVEEICALDIDSIKSMCYNLKSTLDYNLEHYINNYAGRDLFEKLKTL